MVVATSVRAGRATRLLLALQSAKGAPVRNFTASGVSVASLWDENAEVDIGKSFSAPGPWMTGFNAEAASGRYEVPRAAQGTITMQAMPTAGLSLLLQNNWGTVASGAYTLTSQVNKWATLCWIEDNSLASATPQNLVLLADAFIHTIELRVESTGKVLVDAHYAAEAEPEVRALDELATAPAITLPASLEPVDHGVLQGRSTTLVRDYGGANQSIPFDRLTLTLNQNLSDFGWDQMRQVARVAKAGKTKTRLQLTGIVSAQTWAVLSAATAGTKQTYRLTIGGITGSASLTVTMRNVNFEVSPFGKRGQDYVRFQGTGQAHETNFTGAYVDITLS